MDASHGEPPRIDGVSDGGFAAVRDAFARNFVERGEVGAVVAVSVAGRVVVDLWGGCADGRRRRPWRRDTLVDFFSVGKGLSAACVLRLVERGVLGPRAPLGPYLPGVRAARE